MKQIFKIIFISIACVIGGLAVAVGIGFLAGSMNQEIVYAKDLYFSHSQVVSAETIYLQVNTTTSGVTEKTLKLVPSVGGNDVISFPETITIGETFTVVPKRVNGVNKGGNVTLTAEYYSSSANVSVTAKCEILIDIPVKEIDVDLDIGTMTPNQTVNVYLKDNEVSSAINIAPANSLVPYLAFGNKKVEGVDAGKVILLELVNEGGSVVSKDTAVFQIDGVDTSNSIFVDYSYRDVNEDGYKELVFNNSLSIKAKEQKANVFLKAYVYSTYKQQQNNMAGDNVVFNKGSYIDGNVNFKIGDYKISNMTMDTSTKNVMLDEEIRIYLKNENVTGNDINLGISLETDSPGITVQDYYIIDNIYINFENYSDLFTFTNSDSNLVEKTLYGYSAKFEEVSTQTDEWCWIFKVNDFNAYTNYKNSGKPITATITYFDSEEEALYQHSFDIITNIYEADSLSIVYPSEETSFTVRSGDKFNLNENNIQVNSSLEDGKEPTATGFKYYISYEKNIEKSVTTVNTIPNLKGHYKAVFDFELSNDTNSITITPYSTEMVAKNITFKQGDKEYKSMIEGIIQTNSNIGFVAGTVNVVVEFEAKEVLPNGNIFSITATKDAYSETISILSSKVKFYEKLENGNDATITYSEFPYLTISNVRYYIDFEFYTDKNDAQYLEIKETNLEDSYKLSGIGSFYVTAQYVYNDYWLGLSASAKIEVYQELSNLVAYSFKEDKADTFSKLDNFISDNNSLKYLEEDEDKHYIFITSSELQALTNYVNYGQINFSFNQDFGEYSTLEGIQNINKNAITFGNVWHPVQGEDNKVIGFINYYEINPIYSISINGTDYIQNKFNILISINVDSNIINANFMVNETADGEEVNALPITIEDKIVSSSYLGTGDAKSYDKTNPLEIFAGLDSNGELSWNTDLNTSLKYYFSFTEDDSIITTESMEYDLTVDDDSKVNYNNLYKFDTNAEGVGGLQLKNFPIYLVDNVNKGVLLKLKIYASEIRDFNSHYEWDNTNGIFIQKLNNNLESNMYIRVFGLNISLKANDLEINGFKDKEVKLFGNDGLFTLSVKSSNGNSDLSANIKDYTKFMTASISSEYVKFKTEETEDGPVVDYTTLVLTKDFVKEEDIQTLFYIGNNANKVNITIDGKEEPENNYIQKISPAYTLEVTNSFVAPSVEQDFVNITYAKEGSELPQYLQVLLEVVSHTLPQSYGVENPVTIENNKLKFKTVSVNFNANIKLTIINNETNESWDKTYTISVNSIYSANDITIGTQDDEDFYINAGINAATSIVFSENFAKVKDSINSSSATFTNVNANDVLLAETHMGYSEDFNIWSDDLNYDKYVNVSIRFYFTDGGIIVINKTIKVVGNLQISLINNEFNSTTNSSIILTDEEKYTFANSTDSADYLDFSKFEYDNLKADYNKNSFVLGDYFEDSSSIRDYDIFYAEVKQNNSLEGFVIETSITFNYMTSSKYTLSFVLPVKITYNTTVSTVAGIELGSKDGEENSYILIGQTKAISNLTEGIAFNGFIAENLSNVANVVVEFKDSSTGLESENMNYSFDKTTKEIKIWSNEVENAYSVITTFAFELQDGTVVSYSVPELQVKLA